MRPFFIRALACELVVIALNMAAGRPQNAQPDLTALKIEDPTTGNETAASKKEQKVSNASAAVLFIALEDIDRSGSTNLPGLLRMVPGWMRSVIRRSAYARITWRF
jgi:outer membrane cobalamin receptor